MRFEFEFQFWHWAVLGGLGVTLAWYMNPLIWIWWFSTFFVAFTFYVAEFLEGKRKIGVKK